MMSRFLETGVWKPEPTVHLVQDAATNFAILHEKARRTLSFVGRMSWLEPGFQPIEESEETMKPGLNQFHAKRLKALLNASTCSKKLIRSLSIEWLDLHQMNEKFERPMSCTQERFMLGLSHLSIRLADFGCSLEAWDHAAFIIAYASNITDLTIEGSSSRSHLKGRQERVDSLFDKHFPKLRSIHIGGLWIDAEAFEKFLKLHSEIRKIDLKEVHLAKGQQTIANEYEDGHYGTLQIPHYPTLHASRQELWSEVIKFLKDLRMAYVDVWLMADGQLKRRDDIVSYIKGTAPRPLCAYL